MAMMAVRAAASAAGTPASMSRFRGALVAAVLGDCVGGEFEGAEEVPMETVLQHLSGLEDETKGNCESVNAFKDYIWGNWAQEAFCFQQPVTICVFESHSSN